MKKFAVNVLRVLAVVGLFGAIGLWADNTWVKDAYADETGNENAYLAEYSAICDMLGEEPKLTNVTPEEYVEAAHRWKGHLIIEAERDKVERVDHPEAGTVWINGDVVQEGREWLYDIVYMEDTIRCADTKGGVYTWIL